MSQQKDHKRNKSGKQPLAVVSRSLASQDADRETSPPPPPLPAEKTTVSKHQSKKAKKQVHVTKSISTLDVTQGWRWCTGL